MCETQVIHMIQQLSRRTLKEAVRAIWGENGPDLGVSAEARNWKIKNWLKANDRTDVGEATIRRALSEMRSERT